MLTDDDDDDDDDDDGLIRLPMSSGRTLFLSVVGPKVEKNIGEETSTEISSSHGFYGNVCLFNKHSL